ncbi:MAG TPA: TPM domain-containing protein [Dongiaceae bacterium]|jgi:putative membrane protein|nr:TPM domain-containing protein [Dongiaceae bacterium]
MLSQVQSQRIESAVAEAESGTSSEIVVCIVPSSGDDRGTAAIVAALVFVLIVLGGPELKWGINPLIWAGIAIGAAIVAFALCDYFDLGLRCLPPHWVVKDARRAARAAFLDHGLDNTPERNAILLFVSRAERYVEILPDRAAAAAIKPEAWAAIVDEFRQNMRKADLSEAVAGAVSKIGTACAAHFPASGVNPDQVSNQPIQA